MIPGGVSAKNADFQGTAEDRSLPLVVRTSNLLTQKAAAPREEREACGE